MAINGNTVGAKAVPQRAIGRPVGAIQVLTATSTGNGTAYDLGTAHRSFTVQAQLIRASTSTSPNSAGVILQGSLNGVVWHNLGNKTNASTAGVMFNSTANHSVTLVRAQASSKSAGAGGWTLKAWIGVND